MSQVLVACKIPNGLVLRVGKKYPRQEPVLGGGWRTVEEWRAEKSVTVFGPGRAIGEDAKAPTEAGYALTPVDADFWAQWLTDNMDTPLVVNHQIFAQDKADSIRKVAAEKKHIRSGMEPMQQEKDPRAPKGSMEVKIAEK